MTGTILTILLLVMLMQLFIIGLLIRLHDKVDYLLKQSGDMEQGQKQDQAPAQNRQRTMI